MLRSTPGPRQLATANSGERPTYMPKRAALRMDLYIRDAMQNLSSALSPRWV